MQKAVGIMNFKKPGLRWKVLAARMIRDPMIRQMVEVALLERLNSQTVMAINPMFILMILRVRRSLRSDQRVNVSQKKKSPLTRHRTPSVFLLVAAPMNSVAPVQYENCLPRSG